MTAVGRFDEGHIETLRRDGVALVRDFFTKDEVEAVRADFETVFGRSAGGEAPLVKKTGSEPGNFHASQFKTFEAIPFECSPALNLIGVHPALVDFAKAALGAASVHLYQCQAWAKFTWDADYDQPFHCDFVNHTLTVPSEDETRNCVTILCYFSDVSDAHGAMHYVRRTDSQRVAGPEETLAGGPALQERLTLYERSSAAPAGTIVPYGIDIFHRGTNMTIPHGHRFAVMVCYKRAGDEAIGYHAWQYHHLKPWRRIFEHATPEQLACFGVPLPGHPFWTEETIRRSQVRYPGWDLAPYRAAVPKKGS